MEDNRPINARGETWQAVKLTGARAQKGKLASGAPRYTYEVEWSGADQNGQPWKKTYEPAACLVGWEVEMRKIDEVCATKALLPQINPAAEANKKREAERKMIEFEKQVENSFAYRQKIAQDADQPEKQVFGR